MRHIDRYILLAILFYAVIIAVGIALLVLFISAVGLRGIAFFSLAYVAYAGAYALAEILADLIRRH